jgi:hypothetical protein
MRIRMYQIIESLLDKIICLAETARERVAVCDTCGENRYTGAPCVDRVLTYGIRVF